LGGASLAGEENHSDSASEGFTKRKLQERENGSGARRQDQGFKIIGDKGQGGTSTLLAF